LDNFLLYLFSVVLLVSAFQTVTSKNLTYGALYLACSMVSLSGIFFLLGFPFIAGVQLIVYAGAVIVLFVMVLMLFDFKKAALKEDTSVWLWSLPLFLCGLISGVIVLMGLSNLSPQRESLDMSLKHLAFQIFTKYVLIFEALGFLLLIVAIGVVVLSRLDRD